MKINDLVATSLKNLWRRKLRTLLTVLGVLIGSTSIIIMLSMGFALDKNNETFFEQIGGLSAIEVYTEDRYGGGQEGNQSNKVRLDDAAIKKISMIPGVKAVVPKMESHNFSLSKGKYIGGILVGVDFNKFGELGIKLEEGEFPTKKHDAIAGKIISTMFYDRDTGNELKTPIDLLKDKFQISANIYSEDGEVKEIKKQVNIVNLVASEQNMDAYSVFIDIDYFKEIAEEYNKLSKDKNQKIDTKKYSLLSVQTEKDADILAIQEQIKAEGFMADSMAEAFNEIKDNANSTRTMFLIVGIVAFIVAAIGIANTMIMSVYERTKEIGVMKVIGASIKDIRNMFLMEATFIGLIGGIISIGFSYLVSFLLNTFGSAVGGMPFMGDEMGETLVSLIPFWLPFMGVLFATLVGLVSGYLPSRRAMKISAIEAIRNQ